MRVFVTGATGFIGSAVVQELLDSGHEVIGLARSDSAAASVKAAGAQVHRGDLSDLDSLRAGAAMSDGVIHTAFNHDWSLPRQIAAQTDMAAVHAMSEVLVGTNRPIVISSGMARPAQGVATETTVPPGDPVGRYAVEQGLMSFAPRGVRAVVVRFAPTVHGRGDHGFVARLVDIARSKAVSAYPGDGLNRWPAVHRLDAAHLVRLAVESAPAGARLHGVADEGVPVREIADVIGRHLNLPVASIPLEKATEHFGFLGAFFSMDLPASSAITQNLLGWHPVQPGLIEDLEEGHYFAEENGGSGTLREIATAGNPTR